MTSPANSTVQNLLPVQAYFSVDGQFQTFIGQGEPFTATIGPDQSNLNITNSTINSTTIGATTPSTAVFSSGQVLATPSGSTDIANKLYVDSVAAGLSWKQPFQVATTVNLTTRSGFPVIDTYQTVAGDRILVKNQTNAAQNGIYIASSGTWAYAADGDTWNEYISAIGFVEYGSQLGSAWYCSAQAGGTLGTTNMVWSNFSVAGTYFAGTGLTLSAYTFSITNTGVSANTYGSASAVPVIAVNAQGQITSATTTNIAIANTQVSGLGTMSTQNANSVAITGGTIDGTAIGATTAAAVTGTTITAGTQFTGPGTGLTGTATSLNIGGTAANIAGGAAGSLPYQSAANTTTLLAAGTNGQVLTLASGVPSWATPTVGTVTSVSGAGTVNGLTLTGTVTTTGSLTLGGTLDLSSPPAIGGTTAAAITGTTITANTGFKSTYYDASGSGGGNLRTNSGVACFQWGAGGGTNCTVDGSINMNGANAQIDMSPSGTGHVHLNPAGSGSVEINPTAAGTMNNMVIGGTTPLAGTFTTLRVNSTISLAGSTGTSGYAIISNGASAPTWQAISSGLTVTDDTSTNATRYLTFTSATSGTITGINTASTELKYNPSTGLLDLSGATSAIRVQNGTTAQRPGTPGNGMIRYNSTNNLLEAYINGVWGAITVTYPPVNSVAPVISGTLSVGSTLTTTNGTWSNSPTSYAYQWYAGASLITGATSSTFVLTTSENGAYITCQVTASNAAGAGSAATSNSLGPVFIAYTATYLVIAGGAGGGGDQGGGGGAGGYLTSTATLNGGTVYTATVGGGGGNGSSGSNSTLAGTGLTTILSYGGGAGQSYAAGTNGGSGGGGGIPGNNSQPGGSGVSGQGYGGGAGNSDFSTFSCGGGGGGSSGGGGTGPNAGGGSATSSSITGSSVARAGGGGCGSNVRPGSGGGGGAGSGNNGSATANTGSGGGGGTGGNAGSGGSGIIILSVPTASYTGTTTGSPTVTTSGSNTIMQFTSSGTYTA